VADSRSNSVLLSGNPGQRLRMRTLIAHLDMPITDGDYTQVIYLHNAKASELAPLLETVAATLTSGGAKDGAKTATIGFHGETNALVITAPPAVYRDLASVVRQLDVRRAQVMVEAVIAEVSDELADELGVQWQATSADKASDGSFAKGMIGGTNFPGRGGVGGILGAMVNPLNVGPGLNLGYVGGTLKIPGPNGTSIDVLQIGALIHALRGDGRANILSQPSVITLDNQPAEFKVAQEVPFLTGSYAATGATGSTGNIATPFQTIERKDVGLILKVTPHINEGDSVRLDIHQEVSSLAPPVSGAVDLITNKRELTTSVLIADGSLLVLGGLIDNNVSDSVQKVPGLGDIPLLGNLFRYRSNSNQKRDLMVFLHPRILRDAATEAAVSSEKYNYMRTEQLQIRQDRALITPGGERPLLPEVHDFLASPTLDGQPAGAAKP
jgi:general secretion pathway protein D